MQETTTTVATPVAEVPDTETGAPAQEGATSAETVSQNLSVQLNAGSSSAVDSYLSRLNRHISRYYSYPRRARRLGQEGIPVVVFRFRRDGQLLEHYLQTGSGHQLLDQAALNMLKQAAPLPPVPDTMPGREFSYALPVRFRLR